LPHEHFLAARRAFHLRYELLPYIYTMARRCTDAALPLCRPMYYHWPELTEAYARPGQYMFGDDLLVAPVAEPMNPQTQRATIGLWLPPGEWVSWFSGQVMHGGREIWLDVALEEIPLLARSGSIIPAAAAAHRTHREMFDPLILNIMPAGNGRARIYDDDGASTAYLRGDFAFTPVVHEEIGGVRRIVIGPSEGSFAGMRESRAIELRLFGSDRPARVLLDRQPQAPMTENRAEGWRFDAGARKLLIGLGVRSVREQIVVEIAPV
jgi:alpha-glucosidase (family GH31 glycosyl hydrolase)